MDLASLPNDGPPVGSRVPDLGDSESPWEEPDTRYFSPDRLDTPEQMVGQLARLMPDLVALCLERLGPGLTVLRSGALRSPVRGGAVSADSLVSALNTLLDRAQVPTRFAELRWPGRGQAFALCSIEEALELLDDGQLVVEDLGALMEAAAW